MAEDQPEPRRRWFRGERGQKFAREVGSVVLGVLIALGFGAVASEIGWLIEARQARAAMAVELGELIGQADERVTIERCVERRLDRIAAIIREAERTGRLPPLGLPGAPPYRTWPVGVWQSTLAAQTAAHFDRELLDNYSTAYDFASHISFYHRREMDVWTRLYTIAGPGRPFGAEEAGRLREAIGEARLASRMVGLNGVRMKQVTVAFDLGYDIEEAANYDRPASAHEICQRISTKVPADYGQALLDGTVQRAIKSPITRDSIGWVGNR